MSAPSPGPGDLVVIKNAPERGIGRFERVLPDGRARVYFYPAGTFWVGPLGSVLPCPVGFPMMTGGQIPEPTT